MIENDNPFVTHSSEVIYETRWIKVRKDKITHPTEGESVYSYVEVRNSVVVVPRSAENEIFLIKKFAYPTKIWLWELPGGGGEINEDITETARRELAEETGLASNEWQTLGKSVAYNGISTEWQYTLLANNVTQGERISSGDKGEVLDGKFFTRNEIRQMIKNGEVADNQTLAALELFYVKSEEIK